MRRKRVPQGLAEEDELTNQIVLACVMVNARMDQHDHDPCKDGIALSDVQNEVHVLRGNPETHSDSRFVAASDIVLIIYGLLMRPYIDQDPQLLRTVVRVLGRMSNHEFGPFVRLTNPRHTPSRIVRAWAIWQLMLIAFDASDAMPYTGRRWKKGARMRLAQLAQSGKLQQLIV